MELLQNIFVLFSSLSAEFWLYSGVGFLPLALFWYKTGRLFFIGWIVRVLWLVVNLLCFFLWVFALVVNSFFDLLRSVFLFVGLSSVTLIGLCYYAFANNESYALPLLLATLLFFYLVKFGLDEEKFYNWIYYAPRAIKAPPPKIKRDPKKLMDAEKKAELLPRPLVEILLKKPTNFETETEIIEKLDDHLKKLIRGVDNE